MRPCRFQNPCQRRQGEFLKQVRPCQKALTNTVRACRPSPPAKEGLLETEEFSLLAKQQEAILLLALRRRRLSRKPLLLFQGLPFRKLRRCRQKPAFPELQKLFRNPRLRRSRKRRLQKPLLPFKAQKYLKLSRLRLRCLSPALKEWTAL